SRALLHGAGAGAEHRRQTQAGAGENGCGSGEADRRRTPAVGVALRSVEAAARSRRAGLVAAELIDPSALRNADHAAHPAVRTARYRASDRLRSDGLDNRTGIDRGGERGGRVGHSWWRSQSTRIAAAKNPAGARTDRSAFRG